MAVHVPAMQRTDVWHGRFGPYVVLAIIAAPVLAALLWAATLPRVNEAAVADEIRATAVVVDDHAAAMIRIGERITAAATASTAASRATWIAYGQHMVSDGRLLQDLGDRLRSTATVAEADPIHGGNAGLAAAVLQARWEQLRVDGHATAAHGHVMYQLASELGGGVRAGILTDADLQEIRAASAGMADAGDRVARSADVLLASVDQMQRWMAR